jgi:hypothetical protein
MKCRMLDRQIIGATERDRFRPIHAHTNIEERYKDAVATVGKRLSPFFDEHVHKNPQADKVLGGFYR